MRPHEWVITIGTVVIAINVTFASLWFIFS